MLTTLHLTCLKLLPKNLLTVFIGKLANCHFPKFIVKFIIRIFVRIYHVNTQEVEPSDFTCFNEFFIRKLRAECRPIDSSACKIVSPVDGKIGAYGEIVDGTLFQAKGLTYSLEDLVAKAEYAVKFQGGTYITIYLSPRDYHRIHTPVEGTIQEGYYVPGSLFPVHPFAVNNIKNLFAVNERLLTLLYHPKIGDVAVIKVGATVVGKIKVVYDNTLESIHKPSPIHRYYNNIPIVKGQELGRFEMGSTVILLFPKHKIQWDSSLQINQNLQLGQAIGEYF